MKVPMSWFNDYTNVDGIGPREYAEALTLTGSKVETVENLGKDIKNVVTGKILEITEHPDSDHMVICRVDHQSVFLNQFRQRIPVQCGILLGAQGNLYRINTGFMAGGKVCLMQIVDADGNPKGTYNFFSHHINSFMNST